MHFLTPQPYCRSRLALTWALALFFFALPGWASAALYYVDPSSGANSNAGTTAATPWLNPPGTRKVDDTGFWSATWGGISVSNKIKCGDVILLKGGSTQINAHGGAWRIDDNYYTTGCTTVSRITLRVATGSDWSAASGNFVLDGTGITPTYNIFSDHPALITVGGGASFVQLLGAASTNAYLEVKNSTHHALVVARGGGGTPTAGFRADYLSLHDSRFGFNTGNWTDEQISNSIIYNIKQAGLQTGLNNDIKVDRVGFVNVTLHDSGCGSAANPVGTSCTTWTGEDDQILFVGGINVWCVNCTSYNAGERGINTGVIQDGSMGGDFVYHFRNVAAYNNGPTCGAANHSWCSAAGVRTSGNDWGECATGNSCAGSLHGACNPFANNCSSGPCTNFSSTVSRVILVGGIFYGNASMADGVYGGGYQEVWNTTNYNNGGLHGAPQHSMNPEANNYLLLNSIDAQQGTSTSGSSFGGANGVGTADGCQPQHRYTPTALNDCFQPRSSNSDSLGATATDGSGWPGVGTYTSPPSWIGSTNKVGLANCSPNFGALDTTTYGNNNFHLQAGSTAIDAGRFLMLASGAGNSSTTLTVQANGGSGDPRYYFIAPNSFLDAVGDTIQIQNANCAAGNPTLPAGRALIASMTATTIALDRACTWTNGAGVHFSWAGSAPDMGAFESGLVAAPTLLSVQVAP